MAWLALTTADVLNSLSQQEQSSLTDASSVADLATIVADVTALVRGKVASYAPNQTLFGALGTIPEELHAAAVAISRFKFLTHLPGTQLITAWRQQENVSALAQLDAAAAGTLLVAGAAVPVDVSPQIPDKQAISGGEPYFPPYGTWGNPWANQAYWSGAGPYW
jgi:hypothetical protein